MSFAEKVAALRDFFDEETDEPPAPREAPDGWRIVEEPPPAAALEPKAPAQQQLVGRSLLFNWAVTSSGPWSPGRAPPPTTMPDSQP